MSLQYTDPATAKQWIDAETAILVDVREPSEYAREHIIGARLVPLSSFDSEDFAADHDKAVVFYCRSGTRTAANAERLFATGFRSVHALDGGLAAWRDAGLPIHVNRRAPIDLMRQVQIAAGSLVMLGVVLAVMVSFWFVILAAFVGAGLAFAGITGWCGMARVLGWMPWNKAPAQNQDTRAAIRRLRNKPTPPRETAI